MSRLFSQAPVAVVKRPHPELRGLREAVGLSRERVAAGLSISAKTLERYEDGAPLTEAKFNRIKHFYEERSTPKQSPDNVVPRGTIAESGPPYATAGPPGDILPFARVLALPAVRERLYAIQGELIKAGVSEEDEARVMRTIRDRQRIARFAGGSVDDSYTEAGVLQVIDNIAETALSALGIVLPPPVTPRANVPANPPVTPTKHPVAREEYEARLEQEEEKDAALAAQELAKRRRGSA